jgi:methyl-accepting chemotaxis protein
MMGQVVDVMQAITTSSKRIEDIIGVINAIAFQTNILALNAAVEAARAGDQGRGFVVVAAEVRTLSQRSAQAASEISTQVAAGDVLVANTGAAMQLVVAEAKQLSALIDEISRANVEQSLSVMDISTMLNTLDSSTQQNAALVAQAAAAAAAMRDESGRLVDAVRLFKL